MGFNLDRAWKSGNLLPVGVYLRALCRGCGDNPPVGARTFISGVIASGRHPYALPTVALFVQFVDPGFDRGVMLVDACRGGHLHIVRYLVNHIDPAVNNNVAIRMAYYYRHDDCVRFLHARGPPVALRNVPFRLAARPEGKKDDRAIAPSFCESRSCYNRGVYPLTVVLYFVIIPPN